MDNYKIACSIANKLKSITEDISDNGNEIRLITINNFIVVINHQYKYAYCYNMQHDSKEINLHNIWHNPCACATLISSVVFKV